MSIDSLPVELFTRILYFLDGPDRLSLRLCSWALERAVAKADLYVQPDANNERDIIISTIGDKFKIKFGGALTVTLPYGAWDEALRIREILFNRAYATRLCITAVNFNDLPIAVIEQLTDGCVFERVNINSENEQNKKSIAALISHFSNKRLRICLYRNMLDRETLLACKPGTQLEIYGEVEGEEADDNLLLELARKQFKLLRVPVTPSISEKTVLDVVKIVSASDAPQCVAVKIPNACISRFLALGGIRMKGRLFERCDDSEFQIKPDDETPLNNVLIYQNAVIKTNYSQDVVWTFCTLTIAHDQYSSNVVSEN